MNQETFEEYSKLGTWDEIVDRLYRTKEFADLKLIVICIGTKLQQTSFPAHAWILRMSSPEFDRVICELSTKGTRNIFLYDIDPKVIEIMLRHVYKREIQFESTEQAIDVLSVARRFKLPLLSEICAAHVEHRIDAKSVCYVYQRSLSIGHEELFYKSFKFIQQETGSVMRQTDLKNIQSSTLEDIFRQDHLNIESELQLLETLIEWATIQLEISRKAETSKNVRELMNPFLKHIRFLCISSKNFADIQEKTRIFTKEEAGDIFMRYTITNWSELPKWFNQCATSRKYNYNAKPKGISLNKWTNLSNEPVVNHPSECVSNVSSTFRAKDKGFIIRRFVVSLCEQCFRRNQESRRWIIKAKVTIKAGNDARDASFHIPISSGEFSVEEPKIPNLDKMEVLDIKNQFDSDKSICRWYVGKEAPIIRDYLDPDTSRRSSITDVALSNFSKSVEVVPPVYIKGGDVFTLSMVTNEGDAPFYSCRQKPLFDSAPFTGYNEVRNDIRNEYVFVWCAFASIDYLISGGECSSDDD